MTLIEKSIITVGNLQSDDSLNGSPDFKSNNKDYHTLMTIPKAPISMAEVSRHNRIDDCWTVVNGYVYNITVLLKTHPGGLS